MSAILDFEIIKMPSGYNHYTHLIRKLHGIETLRMQRKDSCQEKQGFEKLLACATRLLHYFGNILPANKNPRGASADVLKCQ